MNKKMEKIQILKNYYKLLLNNKGINCVFCHSKPGYGKTYETLKYLENCNVEYKYNAGVTTAVELFKLLHNNNNSVIVLDDVESVLQDNRSINILKAATYSTTKTRTITYKTSARVLLDYPDSFEFTGKIIILSNNSYENKDLSYNALLSRCLKFELLYSTEEIKTISKTLLFSKFENKELSEEEFDFCIELLDKVVDRHFNFRVLNRLVDFVIFDKINALNLFQNSIRKNYEKADPLDIIDEIVQQEKEVKKQFELFKYKHPCSRATFFRFKQQYNTLKKEGYF